jgi:hypothetical protein
MRKLSTHPRNGLPDWLSHIAFDVDPAGGGGGGSSADNPPKADDPPKGSDDSSAQSSKDTDWKAEARKWEGRAKENSKAADEAKALKERLDKLTPLEKLAAALGADPKDGPTDVDKLTERVTDFEKRLAEEQTARFRAEVANEKKLSPAQAKWLSGSTKEELAKSADELLKDFGSRQQADTPRNGLYIPHSGTGDGNPAAGSVSKGREMFRAERDKHKPATELQNQN